MDPIERFESILSNPLGCSESPQEINDLKADLSNLGFGRYIERSERVTSGGIIEVCEPGRPYNYVTDGIREVKEVSPTGVVGITELGMLPYGAHQPHPIDAPLFFYPIATLAQKLLHPGETIAVITSLRWSHSVHKNLELTISLTPIERKSEHGEAALRGELETTEGRKMYVRAYRIEDPIHCKSVPDPISNRLFERGPLTISTIHNGVIATKQLDPDWESLACLKNGGLGLQMAVALEVAVSIASDTKLQTRAPVATNVFLLARMENYRVPSIEDLCAGPKLIFEYERSPDRIASPRGYEKFVTHVRFERDDGANIGGGTLVWAARDPARDLTNSIRNLTQTLERLFSA